jgi:predicted O-linked N-acetylglucosamine transferase (SPINDLY family)
MSRLLTLAASATYVVRDASVAAVVEHIASSGVHVLIDLAGFTRGALLLLVACWRLSCASCQYLVSCASCR